jgi:hypothetical protein
MSPGVALNPVVVRLPLSSRTNEAPGHRGGGENLTNQPRRSAKLEVSAFNLTFGNAEVKFVRNE